MLSCINRYCHVTDCCLNLYTFASYHAMGCTCYFACVRRVQFAESKDIVRFCVIVSPYKRTREYYDLVIVTPPRLPSLQIFVRHCYRNHLAKRRDDSWTES